MSKKVYIRLNDGYPVRRSPKSIKSLLLKDGVAEVQLENGEIGTVSKNMARRIVQDRGKEFVNKYSHNALLEWLSE